MRRPPFGTEPEISTCDACGDRVMLPPGVYYRGEKLHPQCYRIRRKKDVTTEHIAPRLERIGELVDELLTDTD